MTAMTATRRPRRLAIAALPAALALLLAACGGGDDPTLSEEPDGGSASPAGEDTPAEEETTPSDTADAGTTAPECPSGVPLPEDTSQHGAFAVDSSTAEVEAGDQFFEPTCLTEVPQGTLTLTVSNTGQALHNIRVDSQNIDRDVQPGESITVEIEVGSEPIALTCKYHETLGMHGVIVPEA